MLYSLNAPIKKSKPLLKTPQALACPEHVCICQTQCVDQVDSCVLAGQHPSLPCCKRFCGMMIIHHHPFVFLISTNSCSLSPLHTFSFSLFSVQSAMGEKKLWGRTSGIQDMCHTSPSGLQFCSLTSLTQSPANRYPSVFMIQKESSPPWT